MSREVVALAVLRANEESVGADWIAERTGHDVAQVLYWRRRGSIPDGVRVGRKYLWPISVAEQIVATMTAQDVLADPGDPDELMTIAGAAEILQITPDRLRRIADEVLGEPDRMVGRSRLYRRERVVSARQRRVDEGYRIPQGPRKKQS
jgi:hypothetical protein